jgi:hypothetical protein
MGFQGDPELANIVAALYREPLNVHVKDLQQDIFKESGLQVRYSTFLCT